MLNIEQIKDKYGLVSSFAIYDKINVNQKPKHGVGNTSVFDNLEEHQINRQIVLVGLNFSGKQEINKPFSNFHSDYKYSHDYKIRYATQDTLLDGAYMTDLIKNFEEVNSSNVKKYLKQNPLFLEENIKIFITELKEVCLDNPLIICFGNDCYNILSKYEEDFDDAILFKIPHYSSCIKKEDLKSLLLDAITTYWEDFESDDDQSVQFNYCSDDYDTWWD